MGQICSLRNYFDTGSSRSFIGNEGSYLSLVATGEEANDIK